MPLIGSLSGSLTKLNDGTSYIAAGAGTTVVTASDGGIVITAHAEWSDAGSILYPADGTAQNLGVGATSNTAGDYDIYIGSDGAAVFNEQGAAVDFRVESDNKPHAIFVDGSADQVLILSGGDEQSLHAGSFADTNFFVSGTMGAKNSSVKGTSTFGGDVCISGTVYTPNITVGDSSMSFPVTTALNVYANVSGDYAAKIDNDQASSGHVLKLLTDGNGSNSRLLEMEDGDGDTLFRARADGRFGFGPDGVSSMGAGTFVVGIDNSSHTADIAISKRLQHLGDSDTYMDFTAADQIEFVVGNVDMIHMTEDDSQDMIVFNEGGADVDFRVESSNEDEAIFLNAGANELHINKGKSAFATHIYSNNDNALEVNTSGVIINESGHSGNDFRVETDNETHAVFVDSGEDQVLILSSTAGTDTAFFVSGAIWDENWGDHGKVAAFNGDVLMSGCLRIQSTDDDHEFVFGDVPGAVGQDVRFAVSGTKEPWTGGSGIASPRVAAFTGDIVMSGAIFGAGSYYGGNPNTLCLAGGKGDGFIHAKATQVYMETFASTTGPRGNDLFLSVSGTIGGKHSGTGVTALGGDLVVSGALYGSSMGANIPKTEVTHNADSTLTQNTRSGHITLTTDGSIMNGAYGSEFQINSGYVSETDVIMCTTDTQGLFALASDVGNGNFKIKLL